MDVADRHPLDPAIGDDYSKCLCGRPVSIIPLVHCHCDYHDGLHGCTWGNAELVRRLTEGWRENRAQLNAREVAHALTDDGHERFTQMTVEAFLALPRREESWGEGEELIDSFIILPGKYEVDDDLHESGYRNMGFVAITNGVATYRFGGISDNISLDAIGGRDGDFKLPDESPGWQMDCLPMSGLIHVWSRSRIGIEKRILSTFQPRARRRK